MFITRQPLRSLNTKLEYPVCLICQWRTFSSTYRRCAEKEPATPPTPIPSPLADAPRAHGKAVTNFTPKPLSRPIGLPKPPKAGENSGIDNRSWRQRRDDFVNYEKHIAKRKVLTHKMSTPYFREWTNMQYHKGKSFIAPPKLFKSDRALYFPNLHGQTLLKKAALSDTTPVLEDKVSVVSVFSSAWAENQAATFASEKHNPELHEAVRNSGGAAQIVQINIEENSLKAMIIKLFMGSLRRRIGQQNWGRYYLVRKGLSEETRDAIGLLNSKVGYTYLLDGECKIRWAGSGPSEQDEKVGLVKGVRRLVEELKTRKKVKRPAVMQKPVTDTSKTPTQSEKIAQSAA